jgi:hypothetical protein
MEQRNETDSKDFAWFVVSFESVPLRCFGGLRPLPLAGYPCHLCHPWANPFFKTARGRVAFAS